MSTTIMVEARVLGKRSQNLEARSVQLDALPDNPSLAALIEHVVRAEVRAFKERKHEERLVRFLTEAEIAAAAETGKVSSGGFIDQDHQDAAEVAVDEQRAVDTALLAHTDGLFQVIVDGTPVDDQQQLLTINEGSTLMFLRLVALAGG